MEEGITFAVAGREALSTMQVIHIGYNLIHSTSLFELPCREWCQKSPQEKTMPNFQTHFRNANLDRLSTATTGTVGYHGALNHINKKKTCHPCMQPTVPPAMPNSLLKQYAPKSPKLLPP